MQLIQQSCNYLGDNKDSFRAGRYRPVQLYKQQVLHWGLLNNNRVQDTITRQCTDDLLAYIPRGTEWWGENEENKGRPSTHPSWFAVAPSAGSGWHGLDSLRSSASSCGWTAGLLTRQPHRHPPGRWRGLCALSPHCPDERTLNHWNHIPQIKLRHVGLETVFGCWGWKDIDICSPCVRGKVVLHSLLIHREQASVLVCPGQGTAGLLFFTSWE